MNWKFWSKKGKIKEINEKHIYNKALMFLIENPVLQKLCSKNFKYSSDRIILQTLDNSKWLTIKFKTNYNKTRYAIDISVDYNTYNIFFDGEIVPQKYKQNLFNYIKCKYFNDENSMYEWIQQCNYDLENNDDALLDALENYIDTYDKNIFISSNKGLVCYGDIWFGSDYLGKTFISDDLCNNGKTFYITYENNKRVKEIVDKALICAYNSD